MLDVIGDIHGCYEELHALLEKLGYDYDKKHHVFSHPQGRQVVFIGDFIDGGPENVKCIRLVQNMMNNGAAYAIQGNHEFNAVLWATPDPNNTGKFFRAHNDQNYKQHATYLDEVAHNPSLHNDLTRWFKSLPVYLELGNAKFAHACWYQKAVHYLKADNYLNSNGALNEKGWKAATNHGSEACTMIELLLKGPEETLPNGQSYPDTQGINRKRARVSWWSDNPITNQDAYSSIPECDFLKRAFNGEQTGSVRTEIIKEIQRMPADEVIFFGHISRLDNPAPLSDRVICVDYGIKRGIQIVAWRMDNIMKPANGHFVSVSGKSLRAQELVYPG